MKIGSRSGVHCEIKIERVSYIPAYCLTATAFFPIWPRRWVSFVLVLMRHYRFLSLHWWGNSKKWEWSRAAKKYGGPRS